MQNNNTGKMSIGEMARIHVIARKKAKKISRKGVSPARMQLR